MTVHARGYRAYGGSLTGVFAAGAIAREDIRTAWGRKAFRRIGVVYVAWFGMWAFVLYVSMGADWFGMLREVEQRMAGVGDPDLALLNTVLQVFYTVLAFLTALLAVFVGAPLVADDLQAGALPLYLVRPIRATDYVLGKMLVIPALLAVALLLPGFALYLLVGLWQPPGETMAFLAGNLGVLGRVLWHFLVSAAAYTGLVLLLSSRTPRRAVAAAVSGAILFGGVMLRKVGIDAGVHGVLGDAMRLADLPRATVTVLLPHSLFWRRDPEPLPATGVVLLLAAVLLAAGCFATWRRARSVEVTG